MKRPRINPGEQAIRCAEYLRARGWTVTAPGRVDALTVRQVAPRVVRFHPLPVIDPHKGRKDAT